MGPAVEVHIYTAVLREKTWRKRMRREKESGSKSVSRRSRGDEVVCTFRVYAHLTVYASICV